MRQTNGVAGGHQRGSQRVVDVDPTADGRSPAGRNQRQVQALGAGRPGELHPLDTLGPLVALDPPVAVQLTAQVEVGPAEIHFGLPGRVPDVVVDGQLSLIEDSTLCFGETGDDQGGAVLEVDGDAGVTLLNEDDGDDGTASGAAEDNPRGPVHDVLLMSRKGSLEQL